MNLHGNLARVGQTHKGHLDGHFRDELSGKRLRVRLQEASVMQGLRDGPETLLLQDGDHLPTPEGWPTHPSLPRVVSDGDGWAGGWVGGWVVVVVVMVGSGTPFWRSDVTPLLLTPFGGVM